ncbi:glycoside hydrolase family 127 protein [Haoranjiania flava]|uniref:Glycoside hydrolase family 127 protein n=1 Tax=Haoranjiania flava TaxID=1856322 RepID=A0AAE3IMA0_9BACT|nr:glycoside hydrolase family 127 protein [Haoranjiania flava]MCU7693666.1 glycoside hydrolase family 127 protein [Haoranjiania flava]
MKSVKKIILLLIICSQQEANAQKIKPIEFNEVIIHDNFWKPRMDIQQKVLLPHAFEKTRPAVENLIKTGNFLRGIKDDLPFPHRYVVSDFYKVMEGASYLLMNRRDSSLEKKMDELITIIALSQAPDGYMYDAHITGSSSKHEHWGGAGMGDKPYSWVLHSHELYNMGHMYEAAIAYYNATGKRKWLDVAEKNAQHINKVFFIGDKNYNNGKPVMQAPGHEEIELALVKLYHATNNTLYLQMAKKFLDIRGVTYKPQGTGVMSAAYAQQHAPVRDQRKPTGHAVRAAYLYAGMADVSAAASNGSYLIALNNIWKNITDTRMHITGGLGAVHGIEGFGAEYELPNKEAYNETCAAVGNVLFNYRMFLMTGNAKFIDVAEVALYNNVLAGVNLDGNKFFYVNPLESDGVTKFNMGLSGRSEWFETACCPTNLSRLIPQVSGMMYAFSQNTLYCNLYAGNTTTIQLGSGKVFLEQQTKYPFGNKIVIKVYPENHTQKFSLNMRIPTWATNQFVPGELYQYVNKTNAKYTVRVNGRVMETKKENGFITLPRVWKKGDVIELELPMPVRFNQADSRVKANVGKIAVTKGPLVYCAEAIDNAASPQKFIINQFPDMAQTGFFKDGELKNIPFITLPAGVEGKTSALTLIPYYAWNNRGDHPMAVWFSYKSF